MNSFTKNIFLKKKYEQKWIVKKMIFEHTIINMLKYILLITSNIFKYYDTFKKIYHSVK